MNTEGHALTSPKISEADLNRLSQMKQKGRTKLVELVKYSTQVTSSRRYSKRHSLDTSSATLTFRNNHMHLKFAQFLTGTD